MCDLFPPQEYICVRFVETNKVVIAPSLLEHVSTRPAQPSSPVYDPYAGMKTPGQRQLISLQERVKVGEITVDEAVQEFKAWQFDHKQRAYSIRYQHVWIGRRHLHITTGQHLTMWGGGASFHGGKRCVFCAQENLKRLRESITRRHKERKKPGKELGW